jgi:hypothetical protein
MNKRTHLSKTSGSTILPRPGWAPDPLMVGIRSPDVMGWWLGLHQPPWSFGFDSQTRGTRENRATPCVKVPGSLPHGSHLVRDGQTSPHRPRLVVSRITCPPISPPPHANSFVLGPAVINTHTLQHTAAYKQPISKHMLTIRTFLFSPLS